MKKLFFFFAAVLFETIPGARAQMADSSCAVKHCFDCCRPDAYAPLGLMMTDHVHFKKEFSIAYTYMNMQMKGNLAGSDKVSDTKIFETYMMAPAKMNMQMHMLMVMYGIAEKFTVMGMFNYSLNKMYMSLMPGGSAHMHGVNEDSMPTSSSSSGIGDVKLYALYNFLSPCRHRLVAGLGMNLPTGNIVQKGQTMLGSDQVLPYAMQPGTGTFGVLPILTYVRQHNKISWGIQAKAIINIGENYRGYSWGNQYTFTSWLSYNCFNWLSVSGRVQGSQTEKMYGYDKQVVLLSNNDPASNAQNSGGQRADVLTGANIFLPFGKDKSNRISIEYGLPAYQNVQGIQMNNKGIIYLGGMFTF